MISTAFVLAACGSTYKAPGLPSGGDGAIAVLEAKESRDSGNFFIANIDGHPRGIGWFDRFELPPGRRAVTVRPNSASVIGADITRYFTAEAGRKYLYVVEHDRVAKRWGFSIVERDSGNRVDSDRP